MKHLIKTWTLVKTTELIGPPEEYWAGKFSLNLYSQKPYLIIYDQIYQFPLSTKDVFKYHIESNGFSRLLNAMTKIHLPFVPRYVNQNYDCWRGRHCSPQNQWWIYSTKSLNRIFYQIKDFPCVFGIPWPRNSSISDIYLRLEEISLCDRGMF